MRTVIVAAIALLAGFIVGSLGPRKELREAQAKIVKLEADLAARPRGTGLAAQILGGMRRENFGRAPAPVEAPSDATPKPSAAGTPAAVVEGDDPVAAPVDDEKAREEGLAKARTALELRRTQARAALDERANLEDWQEEAFDEAVNKMNDALEEMAEKVAPLVKREQPPNRREAMHLAAEALDVFIAADESFASILNAEQYQAAGEEAVDPLSYIDPALLDMLEEF